MIPAVILFHFPPSKLHLLRTYLWLSCGGMGREQGQRDRARRCPEIWLAQAPCKPGSSCLRKAFHFPQQESLGSKADSTFQGMQKDQGKMSQLVHFTPKERELKGKPTPKNAV